MGATAEEEDEDRYQAEVQADVRPDNMLAVMGVNNALVANVRLADPTAMARDAFAKASAAAPAVMAPVQGLMLSIYTAHLVVGFGLVSELRPSPKPSCWWWHGQGPPKGQSEPFFCCGAGWENGGREDQNALPGPHLCIAQLYAFLGLFYQY